MTVKCYYCGDTIKIEDVNEIACDKCKEVIHENTNKKS